MTLFKSLSMQVEDQLSSTTTDKAPAYPPTAIQLYSTKYIHFLSNTIQSYQKNSANWSSPNNSAIDPQKDNPTVLIPAKELKTLPKEYELLSYQPVYVPDDAATATTQLADPNLGIWDCRCNIQSGFSQTLLKSAIYQHAINKRSIINKNVKPTFLVTIDLDSIENVEPTLSDMMHSILHVMQEHEQNEDIELQEHDDKKASTAEGKGDKVRERAPLRPINIDFSRLPKFGSAPSSSQSDKVEYLKYFENANMIICAILPSHPNDENETMTYKQKQGLNLIMFHLLKYANEIDCTLCFLNQNEFTSFSDQANVQNTDDGIDEIKVSNKVSMAEANTESGLLPSGLSVKQFACIVRGICSDDESLLNDKEDMNNEESNEQQQNQSSSIYFPNDYDDDLISSVYLRSASCAGVWDANTDNLWTALLSSNDTKLNSIDEQDQENGTAASSGEEEWWLQKLAESVSAYTNSSFGLGSTDGSNSAAVDEASLKSSRTKMRGASTVVTTKTKRMPRKKVAGSASKKGGDKDNVSDFFNDLLKS